MLQNRLTLKVQQNDQLTEHSIYDPVAEGLKLMQQSNSSHKNKELAKYQ